MSELLISGLRASVNGKEIFRGVDLRVASGEVHAVMGPNGSGKSTLSHVIAGRPGYDVTDGTILLDGADLLSMPAWERARAGLFLALQYPIEVPGVSLVDALGEAFKASGRDPGEVPGLLATEARAVGFDEAFLSRPLNVDLSGGERKRNEVLQLGVLRPRIAVLDEIDSGLDVDALRAVAPTRGRPGAGLGDRRAGYHPLPAPAFRTARRPGPRPGRRPCGGYRRPRTGPRARGIGICPLRGRGRRGWPRRGRAIAAAPVIVKAA